MSNICAWEGIATIDKLADIAMSHLHENALAPVRLRSMLLTIPYRMQEMRLRVDSASCQGYTKDGTIIPDDEKTNLVIGVKYEEKTLPIVTFPEITDDVLLRYMRLPNTPNLGHARDVQNCKEFFDIARMVGQMFRDCVQTHGTYRFHHCVHGMGIFLLAQRSPEELMLLKQRSYIN